MYLSQLLYGSTPCLSQLKYSRTLVMNGSLSRMDSENDTREIAVRST